MSLLLWTELMVAAAVAAPFNGLVAVEIQHDDNLSRGAIARDERADTAVRGALSLEQPRTLARDWLFTWGGRLEAEHWSDTEQLDLAQVDLRCGWRYRFGLGRAAPALRLDLAAGRVEARLHDRSGWSTGAQVSFSHRPREVLRYAATVAFDEHAARSDFFDADGCTTGAEVQLYLHPRLSVTLGARHRRGDVLAFGQVPVPWRQSSPYLASVPVQPFAGFDAPFSVYSLRASTRAVSLQVHYALGARRSASLTFDGADTRRDGLRYLNHSAALRLTQQF